VNYKVRYTPIATAVHKGAHSVNRMDWQDRQVHWYGNLLTYAAKHYRRPGLMAVCGALILGSVSRAFSATVRRRRPGRSRCSAATRATTSRSRSA
jgi:GT2 family glycosyltransferase